MNLKHHDKYQFELNSILFSTIYNLFPSEILQKCQCYQLYVLRENSNTARWCKSSQH